MPERAVYTVATLRADLDEYEARYGMSSEQIAAHGCDAQAAIRSGFDAHVWLSKYEDWRRMRGWRA